MVPFGRFAILVGLAVVITVLRHGRGHGGGHNLPGGIRISDPACYDRLSRRLGGALFKPIADDERARANASGIDDEHLGFEVGDVADLPHPDQTFDVVVTVLSMHHWTDPREGLGEIARVLRPGGRALVWDLRPGTVLFHRHVPDPVEAATDSPLQVVSVTRWHWPLRFRLLQRIELVG